MKSPPFYWVKCYKVLQCAPFIGENHVKIYRKIAIYNIYSNLDEYLEGLDVAACLKVWGFSPFPLVDLWPIWWYTVYRKIA